MKTELVGEGPILRPARNPATIAIMLAMMVAATWNAIDYEASDWNTLLMMMTVLMAGGLLGKAPRIIFEPAGTRPFSFLSDLQLSSAVGLIHYYDGAALLGLAFTMMAIEFICMIVLDVMKKNCRRRNRRWIPVCNSSCSCRS